ncbi:hypothetical protein ACE0DR_25320 [Azotobacter sp. CWF10]
MNHSRRATLTTRAQYFADYLQNVRATAGDREFIEYLAQHLSGDTMAPLCNMTLDDFVALHMEWMEAMSGETRPDDGLDEPDTADDDLETMVRRQGELNAILNDPNATEEDRLRASNEMLDLCARIDPEGVRRQALKTWMRHGADFVSEMVEMYLRDPAAFDTEMLRELRGRFPGMFGDE